MVTEETPPAAMDKHEHPAGPAYEETRSGAAVLRRRDRQFLAVEGRGPGDMLKGILTGRIPPPLKAPMDGWSVGEAAYSAILTPKGKMVTDLRLFPSKGSGFLLDLPLAGMNGALAHFKKYLNPRFAQLRDRSHEVGMLTVVGPRGLEKLSEVLGFAVAPPPLGEIHFRSPGLGPDLWLLRNEEVRPPALDLILTLDILEEVRGFLEEAGARPLDPGTWDTLRIEAGTPLFGVDMTEDTIPVEAGIQDRAIDHEKGCYTGQEVIVRIRDRGQVNKRLRWIFLGDVEVPPKGAELFEAEILLVGGPGGPADPVDDGSFGGESASRPPHAGNRVGWITSACRSPRFGQTVAMGFVKRRVGVGGEVRLGGPQGPSGRVEAIA